MAETEPTRRKGAATREAILKATSEIIVEKGLDGFTISDIGRRAGVNRALVYHYFQNRDNLVAHAIDYLITAIGPRERQISVDAIERSTRRFIEHPEIGRLIFQLLLSGRPLGQLGKRLITLLEQVSGLAGPAPGAVSEQAGLTSCAVTMNLLQPLRWETLGGLSIKFIARQ